MASIDWCEMAAIRRAKSEAWLLAAASTLISSKRIEPDGCASTATVEAVKSCRFGPAPVAAHRRVLLGQEQKVELSSGAVERAPCNADDVGDDETMVVHEAHDVMDLRAALDTADGAGLDDDCVHAGHSPRHAFEHHQFGALDIDLGERRAGDFADQRIEAAKRHAVVTHDLARRDVLEQRRCLDVWANLDRRLAVAVAQCHGMDIAAQLAREQAHVVQRFTRGIDQMIVSVGKSAVELVSAVGHPNVEYRGRAKA